jgi:hypothetical protein
MWLVGTIYGPYDLTNKEILLIYHTYIINRRKYHTVETLV